MRPRWQEPLRWGGRARDGAVPVGIFVLLAALHTWPLVRDPAGLSRNDSPDAELNEWIVSWIPHQLFHAPLRLFEANIFYPEPRSLAFSEPLLVPALLGAPVRWLGGSPVLTCNLLLIAGFVLTALAGFHVAFVWTGDRIAGLLAGSLLAFNAATLSRLPHLQAQWAPFLPLALLALERVIVPGTIGTWRPALALGLFVALLSVTSGYWAALAVVALSLALLARVDSWRGQTGRVASRLGLGALLALLLTAPILAPYWGAHREQGLTRTLQSARSLSSAPGNYLSTPARLHNAAWSERFYRDGGGRHFPGLVGLGLALASLSSRGAWRDGRRRALVMIAAGGFVLSLGPSTPFYLGFRAAFPPMQGLRDPSRFGYLVLLAVAFLAAIGLAGLRDRIPGVRGALLAAGLVAVANAEALVAPIRYVAFAGFSPVYRRLARETPRTALVEFPIYPPPGHYRNADYVLASTEHWTPLVNGYGGFTPPSFVERSQVLSHFPGETAIGLLHDLGVTHVIVHLERYGSQRTQRVTSTLGARADFQLLETGPAGEQLYRLTLPGP
jgi:hypothetical protein